MPDHTTSARHRAVPQVEGTGMEDEKKAAEAEEAHDAAEPQDAKTAEGAQPQDAAKAEGENVNIHKLERDVANREKRIKELEDQLAKAGGNAKTVEERVADLEAKLAASEKALADEKVAGSLSAAGCVNVKAAKALLEDYDNDVAKLKEACPYLFGQAKKEPASTGGKPAGTTEDDELERLRRIAGIKPKK